MDGSPETEADSLADRELLKALADAQSRTWGNHAHYHELGDGVGELREGAPPIIDKAGFASWAKVRADALAGSTFVQSIDSQNRAAALRQQLADLNARRAAAREQASREAQATAERERAEAEARTAEEIEASQRALEERQWRKQEELLAEIAVRDKRRAAQRAVRRAR
jgi:hypothetical protein